MTGSIAILLSFHELLILLFKMGIDKTVMPREIAELVADETELKIAMGELVTDGYLVPGMGEKYQMSVMISEMMDLIASASRIFLIEEIRGKIVPVYLYSLNMNAVSLSMDLHHNGWIRLEKVRIADFLSDLLEINMVNLQIQRFKPSDDVPDKLIVTDGKSLEDILDMMLED